MLPRAAFKLGGAENLKFSLDCLNAIVSRANPVKSVKETELSLERILKERRKELVGEGLLSSDAMRKGLSVSQHRWLAFAFCSSCCSY